MITESDFKRCPKYNHYDLSQAQVLQIAQKAVEIAKEEAKLEFADSVIEFGKSLALKFFFCLGAIFIGIIVLLREHHI